MLCILRVGKALGSALHLRNCEEERRCRLSSLRIHGNKKPFNIEGTKMLTNQLGYVRNGEQINFNRSACFSI